MTKADGSRTSETISDRLFLPQKKNGKRLIFFQIIFCAALLAVLGKGTLSPGLVGLSVSYALSVTQTLNWLVRMASEVETNIVAVERLKEYADTPKEAEWTLEETKPKDDWPSEGKIEFKQYSARYRSVQTVDLAHIKTSCFDF